MKIEYTFLGGIFPKDNLNIIYNKSKDHIQMAADVLQWHFINGIEKNKGCPINILNAMFIGSYPKHYSDLFIKQQFFSHVNGAIDINVGFCNLMILKHWFIRKSLKKELKKWASEKIKSQKQQVLIVYSVNFIDEIEYIKRIFPDVIICLIIPDLPEYTSLDENNLILQKYNNLKSKKLIKTIDLGLIDYFVLLTKHMSYKLGISYERYTVIEGICSHIKQIDDTTCREELIKKIVYTGTLAIEFGILDLIETFKSIPGDDYELVICGGGSTSNIVREAAEKDRRIKFLGLVSHSESKRIQRDATVLINPRKGIGEFTKYSFPSKLIEYLSTGNPVVCYRLPGIPEEYDDYFFYISDEGNDMKKKIMEACAISKEERIKLKMKSINFLNEQKTEIMQCKKIIELIEKE